MNLAIEKIKRADFCFFGVTPVAKNLQAVLGENAPKYPYAKTYIPPLVSRNLKFYKQNFGNVRIFNNDSLEPIFLGNDPFYNAYNKGKELLDKCVDEYHFTIINKQNALKNKIWVFGLPELIERLYENFSGPGIFSYIHEIDFKEDRLFLITLEPFRGNMDIRIPDTHILSPDSIFNLS